MTCVLKVAVKYIMLYIRKGIMLKVPLHWWYFPIWRDEKFQKHSVRQKSNSDFIAKTASQHKVLKVAIYIFNNCSFMSKRVKYLQETSCTE